MSDWSELKREAEATMPKCCGEFIPTGVEYGGQREMMCCDAWQGDGEMVVNPFDLLSLIQENERLREERDSQQRVCIQAMEERASLLADARRYQWVRDNLDWDDWEYLARLSPGMWDGAIDERLKAAQ